MPNRAHLTLRIQTDLFCRGITPTTAIGHTYKHPRCIDYTVPRRLQTFSPRRQTPSRPFLAAHCPCPQCQSQQTAHWGLGRAGRGAGEPGPASGAASLAGSLPGAWSPMRPPRCGPGPARLPACGNHRSSSEGRTSGWKRRIWEEDLEG